ncbi:MAG TPA: hypothetical protein VN577_07945 [Terriglobales bacterium]|jgi:hypothetical protein|nr:hypothetical protein [Terriglobales bacterium]
MSSEDDLAKVRFGMTEVPKSGGQPGDYEERLSQWFLERSFFRDFTYRNPQKKKGEELADAVVLFDDVALLVQVKAKCGNHEAKAWATEAILKALKQVQTTHASLASGTINTLANEVYGKLDFDPAQYPNMYGIIILAQEAEPFDPYDLVPEIKESVLPVFVFSLQDIKLLTDRFDTAADFIHFIELRTDIGTAGTTFRVNNEEQNLACMIDFAPQIYRLRMQPITPEVLARTVEAFRRKASGELVRSAEWRYGLAIDDMIARAHNIDPDLPWNKGPAATAADVARFLGWLSRDRRIRLGKRVLDACIKSEATGNPEYFTHFQKSRGTVAVYLISGEARKDRLAHLQFLVTYAHFKYQVKQSFGVATDSGVSGRSYDFILTRKQLQPENIEYLKTLPNPFADDHSEL